MNKNDIIRLAQECNLIGMRPHLDGIYQESLERFAAIVAAAEREACAKIVEASPSYDWHKFACEAAYAIRERGQV